MRWGATWRWVSARGYALLPVAALFGVVRSSDVVGVDEKYVLVPKNDKPASKMRRWMYVYLAVDVWTYDLLHITARFIKKNNVSNNWLVTRSDSPSSTFAGSRLTTSAIVPTVKVSLVGVAAAGR
ncbi:MAG: hypothetical protein IPM84_06580 [Anaerolineae bacterium]|nr:hypothetical protein [Anaerolineae bacterium]